MDETHFDAVETFAHRVFGHKNGKQYIRSKIKRAGKFAWKRMTDEQVHFWNLRSDTDQPPTLNN